MSIALCILTHNHGDVLLETSARYFEVLAKYGVDIYLYDSSEDDKTKNLVMAWGIRGLSNVYYLDCRFIENGDEKLLAVLQGAGLDKEYDYIWPCKDRIIIKESYLQRIIQALEERPDAIIAASPTDSYTGRIPAFKEVYTNPVELFRDLGATSTSWDSVIFRLEMLKGIDWDRYEQEYGISKDLPFNQTVTLFARLAELENPKVLFVPVHYGERVFHKSAASGWTPITVQLWGVKWPAAIRRLPALYDAEKEHVIKVETMHPMIFGSMDTLIFLKMKDYLTRENFELIREDFEKMSDFPVAYIDYLLNEQTTEMLKSLLQDYMQSYLDKDYFRAMQLHDANKWMGSEDIMGQDNYDKLTNMFLRYQKEYYIQGNSAVFEGATTYEEALELWKDEYADVQRI